MKVHVIPSEWIEKRKIDAIKNLKYQNSDLLHQMQESFPATEQPTEEEIVEQIVPFNKEQKRWMINADNRVRNELKEVIETLNLAGFIIVKK
jgi:hypothetical protein